MRLFYKNNDIKRMDLVLIDGKVYQYKRADNSLTDVLSSKPMVEGNKVWIGLQIPHEDNLKYIFMGADSIYKNKLIDKIPWNMYKIKQ